MEKEDRTESSGKQEAILCDPVPRPEKLYLITCKVANFLTKDNSITEEFPVAVYTMPNKGIDVLVDILIDEELEQSNRNITLYDMAVMDAVYTLYKYNVEVFTPEMVVRVMAANMDADVTKQKKVAVIESIYKLRHIFIEIDFTKEYKERNRKKDTDHYENISVNEYLLPLKQVMVTPHFHKKSIKGFQFMDKPPLYAYAETTGQIMNVPVDLLRIDGMSMTVENILVRNYIYKRISNMRCKKNSMDSKRIVYDRNKGKEGMMPTLGYGTAYQEEHSDYYKKKKMIIHRKVIRILEWFKKKGFILGYEVVVKGTGGEVYGVDIDCVPFKRIKKMSRK